MSRHPRTGAVKDKFAKETLELDPSRSGASACVYNLFVQFVCLSVCLSVCLRVCACPCVRVELCMWSRICPEHVCVSVCVCVCRCACVYLCCARMDCSKAVFHRLRPWSQLRDLAQLIPTSQVDFQNSLAGWLGFEMLDSMLSCTSIMPIKLPASWSVQAKQGVLDFTAACTFARLVLSTCFQFCWQLYGQCCVISLSSTRYKHVVYMCVICPCTFA